MLRSREDIGVGCNELTRVEGAAVADGNLRGVLVGHDYFSLHQSVALAVRIVTAEGLVTHACMWLRSSLECVTKTKI